MIKKILSISLPTQVTIAVILGLFTGLLIGDAASVLEPLGRAYTMLLEVVVFPYIICTLLTSLGSLSPSTSLRLFKKSWLSYLSLLILAYAILIILGQALPFNITSSNPSSLANTEPNILDLLIPKNLIDNLANNDVPAVIIFCILFGLVLQRIPYKTKLIDLLDIVSKTCLLFWNWIVKFAPLATFALLASISGTIRLSQLNDLSEFLILFTLGSLIFTFWLVPMLISSFVNIRYKEILYELRQALIISAITTLSVVSLPYIQKVITKLLAIKQPHASEDETNDLVQTILLISYPLTQVGNFFVYLYILFSALYFNHAISDTQYLILPLMSYLSSIGSPTSSINSVEFLSNWLNLPVDSVNLYVGLLPVIRYGQVLSAVMGFAFMAFIVSYFYFGFLKINYKKIVTHLIIIFLIFISTSLILKGFFQSPGEKLYNRLNSFSLNPTLTSSVKENILPLAHETKTFIPSTSEDTLFRIQKTGVLRVGFNAEMRPFAFYNNKKQLVGYDIAYAYALAKTLNCKLVLIPFTWQYLVADMRANKFDIAMSAIYVTEKRLAAGIAFTEPYFRSPVSLIVPKNNKDQFETSTQIKAMNNLRIGTFNDPVLIPLIQNNFPNAKIVILSDISGDIPMQAFQNNEIDAVLWSKAQTDVWVLAHPEYVSMIPTEIVAPFLMAYMIQGNSPQFLHFLNYWLELKKNEQFQNEMYNQWILIRPTTDTQPRWSILRAFFKH